MITSELVTSYRQTGRIYPEGQYAYILNAELVEAPEQVIEALRLNEGSLAIQRTRITYQDKAPVSWSTSWFSGELASIAPKLLELDRIPEGTFVYLAGVLNKRVDSWLDQYDPAFATARDAESLDVSRGEPVLHGRNWIYDENGQVLEYGESASCEPLTYRGYA